MIRIRPQAYSKSRNHTRIEMWNKKRQLARYEEGPLASEFWTTELKHNPNREIPQSERWKDWVGAGDLQTCSSYLTPVKASWWCNGDISTTIFGQFFGERKDIVGHVSILVIITNW